MEGNVRQKPLSCQQPLGGSNELHSDELCSFWSLSLVLTGKQMSHETSNREQSPAVPQKHAGKGWCLVKQ